MPGRHRLALAVARPLVMAVAVLLTTVAVPAPVPAVAAETPAPPINDPGPVQPRPFPPGYGPDPLACFSPLRVPAGALPGPPGPDGQPTPPEHPVYLVLNVAARQLYVYRDGTLIATFPTAVGAIDHHTPIGDYSILGKAVYPTWYPPDGRPAVPPGPENPLGSRWLGFSWSGFGLHGTNAEWSIGRAVSLGCVRLRNADVESLFEMVSLGTPLKIVYEPVELAAAPGWGGGFVLSLHPDVYNRLADCAAFVTDRLSRAGCAAEAGVVEWLAGSIDRYGQATWDTASPVLLGSLPVATPVLSLGREPDAVPYVAVRAFAAALGLTVGWDEVSRQPVLAGTPVPAVVVAGRAFAALDDLSAAAGVHLDWAWEESRPGSGPPRPEPGEAAVPSVSGFISRRLTVTPGLVYVDGLLVSKQAFRDGGGTYIPLRAVAQVLGLAVTWEAATGAVRLRGVPVPVRIEGGTSFIQVDDLAVYLDGLVDVRETSDGVFIARRGG